jgi:hypothetical protein
MADKGKIMSQTFYERQSKLLVLYQEAVARKEMNENEAKIALRMIGFSETIAANRAREWAKLSDIFEPETERVKKRRLLQMASLERYTLQMRLGKKYYLRLKFKRNETSKDETVKKLIKKGYTEEIARGIVRDWEAEG